MTAVDSVRKRPRIGLGDFVETKPEARMRLNGPPFGVVTAVRLSTNENASDMYEVENHWRFFAGDDLVPIKRELPTDATMAHLMREIADAKMRVARLEAFANHMARAICALRVVSITEPLPSCETETK